jgi:hypothetical protein
MRIEGIGLVLMAKVPDCFERCKNSLRVPTDLAVLSPQAGTARTSSTLVFMGHVDPILLYDDLHPLRVIVL